MCTCMWHVNTTFSTYVVAILVYNKVFVSDTMLILISAGDNVSKSLPFYWYDTLFIILTVKGAAVYSFSELVQGI